MIQSSIWLILLVLRQEYSLAGRYLGVGDDETMHGVVMKFMEWPNLSACISITNTGPLFTKKMPSYGYRDSHYKPETVVFLVNRGPELYTQKCSIDIYWSWIYCYFWNYIISLIKSIIYMRGNISSLTDHIRYHIFHMGAGHTCHRIYTANRRYYGVHLLCAMINTMSANTYASCIARSPIALVLKMRNEHIIVFHEEGF